MTISKKTIIYTGIILLILALPLVAMQFTTEVNWKVNDFIIAGLLLLATVLSIEISKKIVQNKTFKTIAVILIILVFLLVWIELAVGLFNSPIAGS